MAKVIGSVDARGRPVVRIEGKHESILVIVDTGFNRHLMTTRATATLLGADPIRRETEVQLGDGRTVRVYETRATIMWLDRERRVRVLVSDEWTTIGDEPSGLLGTDLLLPHMLRIDFARRTVEIEAQH
jgi:predicted aspartyl protease